MILNPVHSGFDFIRVYLRLIIWFGFCRRLSASLCSSLQGMRDEGGVVRDAQCEMRVSLISYLVPRIPYRGSRITANRAVVVTAELSRCRWPATTP